jgi:hypothetical protein
VKAKAQGRLEFPPKRLQAHAQAGLKIADMAEGPCITSAILPKQTDSFTSAQEAIVKRRFAANLAHGPS